MSRTKFILLTHWIVALALLHCTVSADDGGTPLRVTTDWVSAHLHQPDVRLIDARPAAEYAAEHIPGAISLPATLLFARDGNKQLLASLQEAQRLFSQAGIDENIRVVVYDSGTFMEAPRVFWALEVYGHPQVRLLDGGLAAWRFTKRAVTNQAEKPPEAREFVPRVMRERLATKLSTRLALDDTRFAVIDSRPPPEFNGLKSQASRYGHIPKAQSFPGMALFQEKNGIRTLKSEPELAEIFRDITKEQRVITYCNRGIISSTTYFVLRELGYDVANYDGSWIEWADDPTLPIVGPEKAP